MQFFLLLLPQQIPATRTHVGPLNTGMVGPEVPGLLMRYTDLRADLTTGPVRHVFLQDRTCVSIYVRYQARSDLYWYRYLLFRCTVIDSCDLFKVR